MRTTIVAFMLVTATHAAEPKVEFDKGATPSSRGIPNEARLQEKMDTQDKGTLANLTLANLIGDSTQTIMVHYFSEDWTEKKLQDYLVGLVTDKSTSAYTFQIWSQMVLDPEVECSITFNDQKQGKLLLWKTCGCIRDSQGRWWFVSLFDYYHRHHPRGTRNNDKKP